MATLSFPAEPTVDGTEVQITVDGRPVGTCFQRMPVPEAIPPRQTRRWKPISHPAMPDHFFDRASYSSWHQVITEALSFCAQLETTEPEEGEGQRLRSASAEAVERAAASGRPYGVELRRIFEERREAREAQT